jgi:hypothetical protein
VKDHIWIDECDRRYPVSEMPLADIYICLSDGVEITEDDDGRLTEELFIERLRIELVARMMK